MGNLRMERIGAIAGILFFLAILGNFFTPETPDLDDSNATILQELADERTEHVVSVYLQGLGAFLFLVFVAGLYAYLRRAEADRGPSVLVILGGVATAMVVLIASMGYYAVVEAADAGRDPVAVRALMEAQDKVFIVIGWTSAAFYLGAALSALSTRSLPAWLGWPAALLTVWFPVTLFGLFSTDDEGGVLGGLLFLGLLLNFIWILATSIVMLRGGDRATEPERAPPVVAP